MSTTDTEPVRIFYCSHPDHEEDEECLPSCVHDERCIRMSRMISQLKQKALVSA